MKPRILLIGKSGSIVQWFEDARDGFEDAGATARAFALNGDTPLGAMHVRLAKLAGLVAAKPELVVFVAVPTRHRLGLLRQVDTPIAVYGRRCGALGRTPHDVHDRWLTRRHVPRLYQESLAVLNVRNELNVFEGLNQRSFEPTACGTAVIHDDVADLARCFEPGKEVLVFRDGQELQEICERVRRDPALALRVGAAALTRVRVEHTCAHRAQTILRDFGFDA